MKRISRRSFIKNADGASIALWLGISSKAYAVAVIADTYWTALQARKKLRIESDITGI